MMAGQPGWCPSQAALLGAEKHQPGLGGGGPWRVWDTGWQPAAWLEGWGPGPDQLCLIPACGFALQAVTLFWHREGPSAVQAKPPLMNARPLAAGCENSECFKARP